MAQKSFKTRFEFADSATYQAAVTWTPIAKLLEIKPPPLKADDIETTNLESPDEFKEFEPGLGDAGESTFKLQWDATQNATLMDLFRQKKGFRVVYSDAPQPSGSKLFFNGWINGIEGETVQKDNVVEGTVTVRVVGKPSFVPKA